MTSKTQNKIEVSTEEYHQILDRYLAENYTMILATFLQNHEDEFNVHVEECYKDHEGKEMKWKWRE